MESIVARVEELFAALKRLKGWRTFSTWGLLPKAKGYGRMAATKE